MNERAPAPSTVAKISLLALVALFIGATVQKIWGVDTWWQLAAGRFFVEHRTFPINDVLSYSASTHEWIEVRWIFCVLMYGLWSLAGPAALITLQVLALGAVWWMFMRNARSIGFTSVGALIVAIGIGAGLSRWVVRPELFTYLFSALFLVLLDRRPNTWRAWIPLVLVQIIWSNTHTLFVMGPVLACVHAFGRNVESVLLKRDSGRFDAISILGAIAVCAACFLNPYLERGALFPILLFTQIQQGHIVQQAIGEMASPLQMPLSMWTPDLLIAALLACVSIASFAPVIRQADVPRLLILLAMLYLSAKAQRNIALLAVMGTFVTLRNVEQAIAHDACRRFREWLSRSEMSLGILTTILSLVGAWFLITDRMNVAIGAPREWGIGVVWWNTPRTATQFINETKPEGPVFNVIRDGGYLAWEARDRSGEPLKVFADGRLEVYGPEMLAELAAISPNSWPELDRRWNFNTVVLPVHDYESLALSLANDPAWALVHLDHRNIVLVRRTAAHQELIAKHSINLTASWIPRSAEPDDGPRTAFARALGAVSRPYYAEGISEAFITLNAHPLAVPYLERAVRQYPSRERPRVVLAPILWAMGREADADRLLAGVDEPARIAAATEAARLLMGGRNFAGALSPLRLAVSLAPNDRALRLVLADCAFQAGDFKTARENYARLLRESVNPNELMKYAFACSKLGDLQAAARAYGDATNFPNIAHQAWYYKGQVLEQAGDSAQASACYSKAISIKPDYREATEALSKLQKQR